jgi:hypothetical protein
MTQTVMTFVAEIDRARLANLRVLLAIVAADPGRQRDRSDGPGRTPAFQQYMVIFERAGLDPVFVGRRISTVGLTSTSKRSWI